MEPKQIFIERDVMNTSKGRNAVTNLLAAMPGHEVIFVDGPSDASCLADICCYEELDSTDEDSGNIDSE